MKKDLIKKTKPYILALFALAVSLSTHASMFQTPDGGKNKDDEWMGKTKAPQKHLPIFTNNDSYIQVTGIQSSAPVIIIIRNETESIVYEQTIATETSEVIIPIIDFPAGNYLLEMFSDSMGFIVYPVMKY